MTDSVVNATSSAGWRSRLLEPLLAKLREGRLRVVLPNGDAIYSPGHDSGLQATLVVERWRALRKLAFGGNIGFAEAFVDGDWTSPDPVALLRLAARNLEPLRDTTRGFGLFRWMDYLRIALHGNAPRGSRRNTMAHYDLGNEFYGLWLDPLMQYSSAFWTDDTPDLEAAQALKLNRITQLLDLVGGERVLEIGCGWGAFATQLALRNSAQVSAITLSPSQLAFARAHAASTGCEGIVDFRLQDYREVSGCFDRIVSIEMLEAVGEVWLPHYFRTIADALEAQGRVVLQMITIAETHSEHYRRDPDFVRKHIFPGGFLPSRSSLTTLIGRAGLREVHIESFGLSYAKTLAEWRRRFQARWPEAAALGFDERFRRLWDYYLAYCEAGFAEGIIDVNLVAIVRA